MASLCAALFSASAANAQYYGGLSLGRSMPTGQPPVQLELAATPPDQPFSTPLIALHNPRTLSGLKFSYPLAAHLAVQGSYTELARANHALAPSLLQGGAGNGDGRSYGLDLLAAAPVLGGLSVFGRAGIQNIKSEGLPASALDFAALSMGQSATSARLGVGVRYDFSRSLGLRLEVERFSKLNGNALGEFGADNYSLGVLLKF